MRCFEFYSPTRIVFGVGTFERAGELAASLGRRPLIVHAGSAPVQRLVELLSSVGIIATPWRQRGEPVVADIDQAVAAAAGRCDCVIGMGGGSAIDAAKAAAAILTNGGSVVDYLEVVGKGQKITRPAAPWMAIPTTAGTGAEATRNAVIGLPEKHFKASIRGEGLLARIALADPSLTLSAPAPVTAASGMDALCQLIESYTSTGASPLTDALALQGIGIAARALPRAFNDGGDMEAREGMSLAALLSGMTLASAGLGAVHGFAAPLGANFPAPHGVVCAALLSHVIAANVAALRSQDNVPAASALARYARIGRQLPGGTDAGDDRQAIDACVAFTAELARILQIPPLSQFGLRHQHIPEMVALARKASSMRFNPVALSEQSLAAVLETQVRA